MARRIQEALTLSGTGWTNVWTQDTTDPALTGGPVLQYTAAVTSGGDAKIRCDPVHSDASGLPDAGFVIGDGQSITLAVQRGNQIKQVQAANVSAGSPATITGAVTAT